MRIIDNSSISKIYLEDSDLIKKNNNVEYYVITIKSVLYLLRCPNEGGTMTMVYLQDTWMLASTHRRLWAFYKSDIKDFVTLLSTHVLNTEKLICTLTKKET